MSSSSPSSSSPSASAFEVLFFGGTGNIGSAFLAEGLLSPKYSQRFHVTVVLRPESSTANNDDRKDRVARLVAAGAKVVDFDFESEDDAKLQQIIRGKSFIVSVLQGAAVAHQRRILGAAEKAGGVKLFIPAEFAFDTDNMTSHSPSSTFKLAFAEELKKSSVPFARIVTGLFTEYLFVPNSGVDVPARTIHIPGGDAKKIRLTVTSIRDTAACIAEILLHADAEYVRNQVVRLGFQTVTWADVIESVAKALKCSNTDLHLLPHTVEELQAMLTKGGQDTAIARFQLVFHSQAGVHWNENDEKNFLQRHKKATGFQLQPYRVEQYALDTFGTQKH